MWLSRSWFLLITARLGLQKYLETAGLSIDDISWIFHNILWKL